MSSSLAPLEPTVAALDAIMNRVPVAWFELADSVVLLLSGVYFFLWIAALVVSAQRGDWPCFVIGLLASPVAVAYLVLITISDHQAEEQRERSRRRRRMRERRDHAKDEPSTIQAVPSP